MPSSSRHSSSKRSSSKDKGKGKESDRSHSSSKRSASKDRDRGRDSERASSSHRHRSSSRQPSSKDKGKGKDRDYGSSRDGKRRYSTTHYPPNTLENYRFNAGPGLGNAGPVMPFDIGASGGCDPAFDEDEDEDGNPARLSMAPDQAQGPLEQPPGRRMSFVGRSRPGGDPADEPVLMMGDMSLESQEYGQPGRDEDRERERRRRERRARREKERKEKDRKRAKGRRPPKGMCVAM